MVDLFGDDNDVVDEWEDVEQPTVVEPQDAMAEAPHRGAFEDSMDARMSSLEKLVTNAISTMGRNTNQGDANPESPRRRGVAVRHVVNPFSSDEDEAPDVQFISSSRKREGQVKQKESCFFQEDFLKEGKPMTGLNTVLLAGVRQVHQLMKEGETADPLLKHLEFLLKKSTLGVYKHDAYVSYNCSVRARADRDGLDAFGNIATEELATSFCTENLMATKSKDTLPGQSAGPGCTLLDFPA